MIENLKRTKVITMIRYRFLPFLITLLCLTLFVLPGCGSGGGGGVDDFDSVSEASLDVTPTSIDSGERFLVTVRVSDVIESGVFVKIRYPSGIQYLPNKSLLIVDGDSEVFPGEISEHLIDESNYLVFRLTDKQVRGINEFELEFRLVGVFEVRDGFIEIDVDENFGTSFDPERPGFTPLDEVGITVID